MPALSSLDDTTLEALCDVLGHTENGLTGSEIGTLLDRLNIADPMADGTKRHRLFEALRARQTKDGCSNNVIAFVESALAPVRYVGSEDFFESRRDEMNNVLRFAGYVVGENGRVRPVKRAATLTEAEGRARALQRTLSERGIHPEVLRFCRAELLQDNYFHAVLEASKSVADRIRSLTGLDGDGDKLVTAAFGGKQPRLAINSLATATDWSEHTGFANLLRGMFGTFRNTTGHDPKIHRPMSEADALDMFTLASYFHRRLEQAVAPNWH